MGCRWSGRAWWSSSSAHDGSWNWGRDGGWHGQSQWDGHDGSSGPDPPDNDVLMPNDEELREVDRVVQEKEKFWASEGDARLRTASALPFEIHQLSNHQWEWVDAASSVKKLLANYGAMKGGGRACKSLLQALVAEQGFKPGQVADVRSVAFPLCKHLFVSGVQAALPDKSSVPPGDLCHCLPQTALMPCGCKHKKNAHYSRAAAVYTDTLCFSCSTCVRCGKQLDIESIYLAVVDLPDMFSLVVNLC